MALVSMRGVSLGFGLELLLDNIDLNIELGDRACLVGRNGSGKSSLLKILHGDLAPDRGEILTAAGTKITCLPQDVPADLSGTAEEIVTSWVSGRKGRDEYWDSHHVVNRMLSHLSLDAHAPFERLSGGQKRRVLLARALACEPDLLLLDEPTNHLDIQSICWLEEFLLRHCKTFLFVTHDRAFLRRVANRIIDLDRGKIAHWACDYDTFLVRKTDLLNEEQVRNERFDKKLSQEEVWIRQGIKARRTRNEGRVRKLIDMRKERKARRMSEGNARLHVQQSEKSGNKVLEAKSVSFSYQQQNPVIRNFSTLIMRGDHIGIIGPNGSGKTTLLRLFAGELQPDEGEVLFGTRLETIYFDQYRTVLDDNKSVVENVGQGKDMLMIGGRARHVISYLQDFLFTPERARSPVSILSGGERNRLMLAMLFARPSNLLIMDEPTNDLDAETLELLEEQLTNYTGTILMVSHDRAFLDNVVTGIIAMEGNGAVNEYVGGYQDYEKACIAAVSIAKKQVDTTRKPERRKQAVKFGYRENREMNELPRRIEKLEEEQAFLQRKMTAADYYKTNPAEIASDNKRIAELFQEIENVYNRWTELEILKEGQNGVQ